MKSSLFVSTTFRPIKRRVREALAARLPRGGEPNVEYRHELEELKFNGDSALSKGGGFRKVELRDGAAREDWGGLPHEGVTLVAPCFRQAVRAPHAARRCAGRGAFHRVRLRSLRRCASL